MDPSPKLTLSNTSHSILLYGSTTRIYSLRQHLPSHLSLARIGVGNPSPQGYQFHAVVPLAPVDHACGIQPRRFVTPLS